MKTPIEELIDELKKNYNDNQTNPFFTAFSISVTIAEKYLEKEKENMKHFFYKGDGYSCSCYDSPTDKDFEECYNETFKK